MGLHLQTLLILLRAGILIRIMQDNIRKVPRQKEEWKKDGNGFVVQIAHWTFIRPEEFCTKFNYPPIEHNWNVYACIFTRHPIFKNLSKDISNLFDIVGETLEGFEELFHCGITYNEPIWDGEEDRTHFADQCGGIW